MDHEYRDIGKKISEPDAEDKGFSATNFAKGAGAVLCVGLVASVVAGIDYLGSKKPDEKTYMMTGRVEKVVDVYKIFGSRGRFATQGDGFSAWFGAQVQKGLSLGNNEIGYILSPQTLSYHTTGGIFFKSEFVQKDISSAYTQMPIISDVKLEGIVKGSIVKFEPSNGMSIGELIAQGRPKSLSVNGGEHPQKYEAVIYHPPKFSKVK